MQIVGHRGARGLAEENSIAAFWAAAEAGADRIEFDVIAAAEDQLLVAHSDKAAQQPGTLTLDQALEALAEIGLPLSCDLKSFDRKASARIAEALAAASLDADLVVCSHRRDDLDAARAAVPELRRGWSLPQFDVPGAQVAVPDSEAALEQLAQQLPALVRGQLADGQYELLMVQHRLIGAELVEQVHCEGGQLHAWTVNDIDEAQRLYGLGVDAITSDRPDLMCQALKGS